MPQPPGRGRLLVIMATLVALFGATAGVAHADSDPAEAAVDAETVLTGPLAEEMAQLLHVRPGGVQVSENAMAWDGGGAIMVWPSPGEAAAPAGLGANVKDDVVQQMGLTDLASPDAASSEVMAMGSASTCPSGYYCFYTGTSFNGSRLQFSSTCSGSASSWGFNNSTSSWANRSSNKVVYAYDYRGGAYLWTMSRGTSSSYVGAADNNRMSYWKCRYL